jgi:hypothetical protein
VTDDFGQIERRLDELERRARAAALRGLRQAAQVMQRDAQETSAYAGMSGATRAATVAVVISAEDDGAGELQAAYNRAAEHLGGFVGHAGHPLLTPAGSVSGDEITVVLTVPTDYIDDLETERAGEKAFLGPTMDAHRQRLAAAAAAAIRKELGP